MHLKVAKCEDVIWSVSCKIGGCMVFASIAVDFWFKISFGLDERLLVKKGQYIFLSYVTWMHEGERHTLE